MNSLDTTHASILRRLASLIEEGLTLHEAVSAQLPRLPQEAPERPALQALVQDLERGVTEIAALDLIWPALSRSEPGPGTTPERLRSLASRLESRSPRSIEATQEAAAGRTGRDAGPAEALLKEALAAGASDIHLEPTRDGGRVRLRVDGFMRETSRTSRRDHDALVATLKDLFQMDPAERLRPQDGRCRLQVGDRRIWMRATTGPYVLGEALTLRIVPELEEIPGLDRLGIEESNLARIRHWLTRPWGLIAVTGATGSGKTSTLYAMLSACDREALNVVSVEQPVEYIVEGVNQLALEPRSGLTWPAAMRAQLRHDPDVLFVGEVQTPEIAQILLQAALTGRLVLTAFHADSVSSLFARLIAMDLSPAVLAEALTGVVAQRLLRRLCPACKQRETRFEASLVASLGGRLPDGDYYRPAGCGECGQTGYRARLAISEIGEPTAGLAAVLCNGADPAAIRDALDAGGFPRLLDDGLAKAARGVTSLAEVARVCLA